MFWVFADLLKLQLLRVNQSFPVDHPWHPFLQVTNVAFQPPEYLAKFPIVLVDDCIMSCYLQVNL